MLVYLLRRMFSFLSKLKDNLLPDTDSYFEYGSLWIRIRNPEFNKGEPNRQPALGKIVFGEKVETLLQSC
jgi:hypothetical protein